MIHRIRRGQASAVTGAAERQSFGVPPAQIASRNRLHLAGMARAI